MVVIQWLLGRNAPILRPLVMLSLWQLKVQILRQLILWQFGVMADTFRYPLFFVFTITSTMLTAIMRPGRHPINNCTDILATPMLILIPVSSATLVDVDPTLRHAASDRSNSSLISVPAIAATISGGIFACLTCAMLSDKIDGQRIETCTSTDKLYLGQVYLDQELSCTYGRRSILWQLLILWHLW